MLLFMYEGLFRLTMVRSQLCDDDPLSSASDFSN